MQENTQKTLAKRERLDGASPLDKKKHKALYYDKAINLALSENENLTLWESYLEKGNLLKKQGKLTEAQFYYLNSINIIETLRSKLTMEEDKASFLGSDKRLNAYHNLIDLLINLNKQKGEPTYLAQAFNFMERAKSRAFLDSIDGLVLVQRPGDPVRVEQGQHFGFNAHFQWFCLFP